MRVVGFIEQCGFGCWIKLFKRFGIGRDLIGKCLDRIVSIGDIGERQRRCLGHGILAQRRQRHFFTFAEVSGVGRFCNNGVFFRDVQRTRGKNDLFRRRR